MTDSPYSYPFEDYQRGLLLSALLAQVAGNERWQCIKSLRQHADFFYGCSAIAFAEKTGTVCPDVKRRKQRQHNKFSVRAGQCNSEANAIEQNCKAESHKIICRADVVLVGFPHPRYPEDQSPVCIPMDITKDTTGDTVIKWTNDEVRGSGLYFQKVRACKLLNTKTTIRTPERESTKYVSNK